MGPERKDEVGADLGKEPLDGLAVRSVTQFPGQPENTGATGDGYPNSPVTAVDFGVSVAVETTPLLRLNL